jgi:hypothetical protein
MANIKAHNDNHNANYDIHLKPSASGGELPQKQHHFFKSKKHLSRFQRVSFFPKKTK